MQKFMLATVVVVFLHVLVGIALLVLRSTAKRKIPKASINPLKALTQMGQSAPEDKFLHALFFANSLLIWCYPVLMVALIFL
jgi:hypothetical protein